MEKSAREETLEFNVKVVEENTGIQFRGSTTEDKEKFVNAYRALTAESRKKLMDNGYAEYLKSNERPSE